MHPRNAGARGFVAIRQDPDYYILLQIATPKVERCKTSLAHGSICCVLTCCSGLNRAVDLVAARDISVGEMLTLNYGERPMRDLLRGYGFTPAHASVTDPLEVFENLGDGCQALCIQGSGKVFIY